MKKIDSDAGETGSRRQQRLMALLRYIPYGLGTRMFALLLGNPLFQILVLRGPRRQFLRLCRALGVSVDLGRQFALHLSSRFTIPWRVSVLSHCDDAEFNRWVRVENGELLDRLQAEGRPVLLVNCHTAIARLTPLVVLRQGHELAVIEPEPYLKSIGARGADRIRSITLRGQNEKFWMKELYQAQKVLLGKGIVHLALDGHQGAGGVERSFLGTHRLFHVSMAQLAIQLGASIVLVRALLEEDGKVTLQLSGPLDTGSAELPIESRMSRFLDHYVTYLETLWREQPGNISPRHLRHFLQTNGVVRIAAEGPLSEVNN